MKLYVYQELFARVSMICLILLENIDWGRTLELHYRGSSNEYIQYKFVIFLSPQIAQWATIAHL